MGKRLICAFAAVILLAGMAFASPVRAAEIPDVTDYSYTVTPLLEPFCYYLYVQTDNPDPTSFRLVDVTFEGETRTYGGAGAGGNDPLYSTRIQKVFTFQGAEDLGRNGTVEDYRDVLLGYQTVASEDLQKYQDLVGGTTFKKTNRETGGT